MSDINIVTIVGRLGADPELKTFRNGGSVCKMRVATSRQWKDKETGEKKEATAWHSVDVFGPQAESCATYLKKGRQVGVVGSLEYSKVGEGSEAKFFTTIRADTVQFLGSKGDSPAREPGDDAETYVPTTKSDDIPF